MTRKAQLQYAAEYAENFLDRMIIKHPRSMCVACGVAGLVLGWLLG